MRRIQKYLSGLCAAALLLSLLLAGTAKADEITIYLMAENDQMLDLPLSAMPAWINGDIYVPYTAFDWTVTGVNLGVSYGQERTETEYKFTLYSLNGMLVFDLNAGTCTDGFSGEAKDMRAALRNGRVFVPLAGVCSFFGLNYTYTPTNYGTLIRITNGQERLDTQQFVTSASGLSMPTRYYKYLQELNQGTQPTPSPSPTPSGGGHGRGRADFRLPLAQHIAVQRLWVHPQALPHLLIAESLFLHQAAQAAAKAALPLHLSVPPVPLLGLSYHILSPFATETRKKPLTVISIWCYYSLVIEHNFYFIRSVSPFGDPRCEKMPRRLARHFLVEEGGFEPPKRIATDLQSAKYFPFPLRRSSSATYRPVLPMHYPNIF